MFGLLYHCLWLLFIILHWCNIRDLVVFRSLTIKYHIQGKGREGKGREGKGREGKGREGKGREGKGREGKGREGKGREG